ncbi:hypothetical protein V5799_000628 [Amblyomma americanum]|uniref:Tick transposon n=1 Tax=Amblyomma americanum TaxID=6943 RepID=A0AAQ4D2I0_AMBAM
MDIVKPPEPLQFSGNLRRNWHTFKQKLELFFTATPTTPPRSEAAKTAILLSAAGEEALDVYNNFSFEAGESKEDYQTVLRKFEAYCVDEGNEVYERHVFRLRVQDEGEPFEQYLRQLKKQAKLCNFGTLEESMIRDQVVFGTNNPKIREKMLREKDLTLQKAEQMCKAAEVSARQNAAWSNDTLQVDYAHKREHDRKPFRCRQCNRAHAQGDCPAYGKICYACKKPNHFAVCCRRRQSRQVDEVKEDKMEDGFDILDIGVCGISDGAGADWTVSGNIRGKEIRFKVDTGSQANIVPVTLYRRLKNTASLQKSTAVLKAYNGSAIKHVGVDREILVLNGVAHVVTFFVVKKGRQAILGLQTCQQFGLVPKAVDSVEWNETAPEKAFPDLFQGTGCVGRQYRMVLRADAVPVVHPARRVPLALRDPLRQELERMEKAAIIKKVDEPTEWFVPGKDLLLADMLSRAPVPTQASSASSEADCDIHAVQVVSSIVSTPMKERLEKEIRDDPYLSEKMAALRANCCKADASALPCLNTTRIPVSQCESIANLRGERYCHLSKRAVQFVCTATTGHAQQQ